MVLGHVVSGALDGDLVAASVGSSAAASNGGSLAITQEGDNLFAGGVAITGTDIQATNGIIHTVGGVIGAAAPGGEEEPPVVGEEPPVVTDGGNGGDGGPDLGPSLNNLNAIGFTDYVTLLGAAHLGTSYDTNGWTAFIPDNASIPDAALGSDQGAAFAILNNHIITTGVVTFDQLSALGDTMTNSGLAVTFGGTAAAPTVNGFAITEINSPGSSALYSINGLIQ